MMTIDMCTGVAPVNIAVIKYWGKRDERLIIPLNDSISVTLSKKMMCAKTTVACSKEFDADRIWLNGKEEDINNPRLQNCIAEIRNRSPKSDYKDCKLHICSENNFPTAAGLASSAAGFACLVYTLAELFGVDNELSSIARQGSGSACRSMYGGFVHWIAGPPDSYAIQVAPKDHWPELRAIILVVNASKKSVSSTKGMQQSVETSQLLQHRASKIVPGNVERMREAVCNKDFETFAEITMKESNQFHAVCLDTFPPIHYLNATSFHIINLVHLYNDFYRAKKIAYTFDAGPNACLYLLEDAVDEFLTIIQSVYNLSHKKDFIMGLEFAPCQVNEDLLDKLNDVTLEDKISYVINTEVGNGPKIINDPNKHLLDKNGLPISGLTYI